MITYKEMSVSELEKRLETCELEEEESILRQIERTGQKSKYLSSEQTFEKTFVINKIRLERLQKIITSQNKILSKIQGNNACPIKGEVLNEFTKENDVYLKYKISCTTHIKTPGYNFLGYMRKNKDGSYEVISKTVDLEIKNISRDMNCFRCKEKRKRNYVFLFEKKNRQIKVGSSCIDEFLGVNISRILNAIARVYEDSQKKCDDVTKEEREEIDRKYGYYINDIINATKFSFIEDNTWVKRNNLNTNPTLDKIDTYIKYYFSSYFKEENETEWDKDNIDSKTKMEEFKKLPSNEKVMELVIEEFKDVDQKKKYWFNFFSAIFEQKEEQISVRRIICSYNFMYICYAIYRVLNKESKSKQKELCFDIPYKPLEENSEKRSSYVGEKDDNLLVLAVLEKKSRCRNHAWYLRFRDNYGNRFTNFNNTEMSNYLEYDKPYLINSKVKSHDIYRTYKTTNIEIESIKKLEL